MSDFNQWNQLEHASDWILFAENMGPYLSIDETSLSQGELYTVVTNKQAKGRKGTLIALVKGTNSDFVRNILEKIPLNKRNKVVEITLDMASTMERIAKYTFPRAKLVTDRFHVQKLAYEAVQEVRIRHRWEAIEEENNEIESAKKLNQKYIPEVLENGDSLKQLLARSRYLLFKPECKWTSSQVQRANLLFAKYPDIKETYDLSMELGRIYQTTKEKGVAYTRLAKWYERVERSGYKSFNVIAKSISEHYINILNFFDNRSTNASAESFNAKIKAFRASFRGVTDISFFLFRLSKVYA